MADEKFKLPGSSFDLLKKIIVGYANAKGDASIEDLAKLTTISKFIISKNNLFLSAVNIISGGNKKSITPSGAKLARALEHNQTEDITKFLTEIISSNSFLSNLLTTIRIKGTFTKSELSKHILYVSGEKDTTDNRTGTNAVIDFLEQSGLVDEEDGKLKVVNIKKQIQPEPEKKIIKGNEFEQINETVKPNNAHFPEIINLNNVPSISINIQLQLPETDDPTVYENLFKALRRYLMTQDEEK